MGVAVLHPQDCLKDPFARQNLISPHMKHPRNLNPIPNRNNRAQSNRRRRSPSRSQSNSPPSRAVMAPRLPNKNLVMGQVKILKRGEELTELAPEPAVKPAKVATPVDLDLGSTERLGPDPMLVPTQTRLAEPSLASPTYYAGSAFFSSPPPSSLPLPAFFTKKSVTVSKNNDATSDLRRILRLDLA